MHVQESWLPCKEKPYAMHVMYEFVPSYYVYLLRFAEVSFQYKVFCWLNYSGQQLFTPVLLQLVQILRHQSRGETLV